MKKMPSPEQISNLNAKRTLSDAELIKAGAKYKGAELKVTDEQYDEAKGEMNVELQAGLIMNGLALELEQAVAKNNYADIAKISSEMAKLKEMIDNHNFPDAVRSALGGKKGRYASPKPEAGSSAAGRSSSSEGSRSGSGYSSN